MAFKNVAVIIGILVILGLGGYFTLQNSLSQGVVEAPAGDVTPEPGSQTKININAVCEGALAYMTFPDAAASDAFVAECKEGKHPEVLEKYKADMGLGDGKAI